MTNYSETDLELAFYAGLHFGTGDLKLEIKGDESAFDVWFENFNLDEDEVK